MRLFAFLDLQLFAEGGEKQKSYSQATSGSLRKGQVFRSMIEFGRYPVGRFYGFVFHHTRNAGVHTGFFNPLLHGSSLN